jgi:hypothetical protein
MYPHATVDDLNKAFPLNVLQETKTDEPLLVTVAEKEKLVKASKTTFDDEYFEEWKRTHFYVTLPDGTDLMLTVAMWPKEMFEKMMAQAKLYDIEFAKYEAAEKGIGKRHEPTGGSPGRRSPRPAVGHGKGRRNDSGNRPGCCRRHQEGLSIH